MASQIPANLQSNASSTMEPCGMISRAYTAVTNFIHSTITCFFQKLGYTIALHPYLTIFLSILVSILFGLGNMYITLVNDPNYLWAPQTTGPAVYWNFLKENFPNARFQALLLTSKNKANILEKNTMSEVFELHNDIMSVSVNWEGKSYNYSSLCEQEYSGGPCTLSAIHVLGIFQFNETLFNSLSQPEIYGYLTMASQSMKIGQVLGKIDYLNTDIVGAESILMFYNLRLVDPEVYIWEQEFLKVAVDFKSDKFEIYEFSEISFDLEIDSLIFSDMPLIGLSIVVIFIDLAVSLGHFDKIKARIWLAGSAVLLPLLSTAAAFGIGMLIGLSLNIICLLIAFIVLAVGVDDMIVILDALDQVDHSKPLPERFSIGLGIGGRAITLTGVSTVIAFFVSSSIDLPGIRDFCILGGFAFLFNYLLQVTLFAAFVVVDEQRIIEQRNFCCPCCCSYPSSTPAISSREPELFSSDKISTHPDETDDEEEEHQFKTDELDTCFRRFTEKYFFPYLFNDYVRLFVIIFFLALAGVSAWLITKVEIGMPLVDILPDGSYVASFLDKQKEYFGNATESGLDTISLIVRDLDVYPEANRDKIHSLMNEVHKLDFVINQPDDIWFDTFFAVNPSFNISNSTSQEFYSAVYDWTHSESYSPYNYHSKDLIFNSAKTFITASRYSVGYIAATEAHEGAKDYHDILDIFDKLGLNGFGFHSYFIAAVADTLILSLTIQNVYQAILGVLLILSFLIRSFTSIIMLIVCVAFVDLDLGFFMYVWDIKLNSVSFVCISVAAGLSIDYCVHVANTFLEYGYLRDRKVASYKAAKETGVSVTHGALTSWVGIMVLAFSSSSAFRTFFKMIFVIILGGLFHGVIFLPVALSYIGILPTPKKKVKPVKETELVPTEKILTSRQASSTLRPMIYKTRSDNTITIL